MRAGIFECFGKGKLIPFLLTCIVLLVGMHVLALFFGASLWQLERTFHLGRETNVPTWFSSLLLILCGIAAARCAQLSETKFAGVAWALLSLFMFFLSCDETAALHENLSTAIENRLESDPLSHFKATQWPLRFAPVMIVVFGGFAWSLKKVLAGSRRAALLLISGAALFIGGAMVLEMTTNFLIGDAYAWHRKAEILLEETMEMLGAVLFLAGLLAHEKHLLRPG